jgi:hypothetical protein
LQGEEEENVLITKEQAMDRSIAYTGGRAAGKVAFGKSPAAILSRLQSVYVPWECALA